MDQRGIKTYADLATMAGWSQAKLYRAIKDGGGQLRIDDMRALAITLCVTLSSLLEGRPR